MLGEKLKSLRISKNISQKEVAEAIEVSVGMISKYECGLKNPSVDTLGKLADFYDVSLDYLKGNENQMDELELEFPEGIQVLRRATKELTPEARAKMIKLMRAFLEEE